MTKHSHLHKTRKPLWHKASELFLLARCEYVKLVSIKYNDYKYDYYFYEFTFIKIVIRENIHFTVYKIAESLMAQGLKGVNVLFMQSVKL